MKMPSARRVFNQSKVINKQQNRNNGNTVVKCKPVRRHPMKIEGSRSSATINVVERSSGSLYLLYLLDFFPGLQQH